MYKSLPRPNKLPERRRPENKHEVWSPVGNPKHVSVVKYDPEVGYHNSGVTIYDGRERRALTEVNNK